MHNFGCDMTKRYRQLRRAQTAERIKTIFINVFSLLFTVNDEDEGEEGESAE